MPSTMISRRFDWRRPARAMHGLVALGAAVVMTASVPVAGSAAQSPASVRLAQLSASGLAQLSSQDRTAALRAALTQGAQVAVGRLGVADGFLGNPEVKIPLPGKLQKAEKMLRTLGLGDKADALVIAMNRAAEAAVPEAKTLLVDSVKQMSIADAASILTGPADAGTAYFRRTTSEKLTGRFLPIVRQATAKVGVAQRYNEVAGKAAQFGLLDAKDATVENYVTQKTLDGLFLMMAKEEAAIRANPLGQSSKLLQKVFGALGR
jgi:hypothetical protein